MARTAPAPNVAATPGMNPGAFVQGGGGAGGDGNGNGSGGNGNGQGANGRNGGNDAQGGGNGSGACGPGSGGGCPNPSHAGPGTAAGDPVDVTTGRVWTSPILDLVLPGPLPLLLYRGYSSTATDRDIGLGPGWSHSLGWEVVEERRAIKVYRGDGTVAVRDKPAVGGTADLGDGITLRRDAEAFVIVFPSGQIHLFSPASPTSSRWLLTGVTDTRRNRLMLSYEGGALSMIVDSVGREVRVRRHPDGHIAAFEVNGGAGQWVAFRRYEFDANGDLSAAIDGEGFRTEFLYDAHLIVRQRFPSGLTVHYRYDRLRRCTETWCDHAGAVDASLAADVPKTLADNQTKAKGVLHVKLNFFDDFTEVVDSTQVRRYLGNAFGKLDKATSGAGVATSTFDQHGNCTSFTDASSATTEFERDATGRLTSITDPSGARTIYQYNGRGNLVQATDALGRALNYSYDAFNSLVETADDGGSILALEYDSPGNLLRATLPDGATTQFRYDSHGNLVELVEPNGKPRRIQVDDLGRVLSFTDEEGFTSTCSYNRRGQLRFVNLPDGGVQEIDYDADGRPAVFRNPDGATLRFHWAGYGVIHRVEKPDGSSFHLRYDRECNLVQVIDAAGATHDIVRDVGGRIVEERTFDGRSYRYQLDLAGRFQAMVAPSGTTTFTRDACGRVVERAYDDDTNETFEYDAVGRLVCASNALVRCDFTYDARGRIVRESQTYAGKTHVVESEFALSGKRAVFRTSSGHLQRIERNAMGLPTRVFLDEESAAAFYWDGRDAEVERTLPGGGRVQSRYDAGGRIAEQTISAAGAVAWSDPEPDWIGELPRGTTYRGAYRYSPSGELREAHRAGKGTSEIKYDTMGRVLAWRSPNGEEEAYRYDLAGGVHEVSANAPARLYERGGKLVRRGDAEYRYDAESRLVAKTSAEGEWRFEWNAQGLLAEIERPDGTKIVNVYDPFARRIEKRVIAPSGVQSVTRFVWDVDSLVEEICEEGPRVRRRTYAYRWDGMFVLAHRERVTTPSAATDSGWIHHVSGPGQRASLFVASSGEIAGELELGVWGATKSARGVGASVPWRYPGQYVDEETGLAYNRYRFYDPETARFLSPDPIGLQGGLEPFSYAHLQPFQFYDPLGFAPVTNTVTGSAGSFPRQSGGPPGPIHPVIEAALPPRQGGCYPRGNAQPPTACGEPRAMSDYIRAWEQDPANGRNGRPLDPNNPRDRGDIQRCLGSISNITSTNVDQQGNTQNRAPCPNCSQMFANLHQRYGAPSPSVIAPGATSRGGTDNVNFSPPDPGWVAAQQAAIRNGGGHSGPQPPIAGQPVPPPTGPAHFPHSGYGTFY